MEKSRFFLIFAKKCVNWVLILQINDIYGPLGVWVQNTPHSWLIYRGMKCIRRKKVVKIIMKHCRNTSCLPLPLRIYDNLLHTRMRPIPDWLSSKKTMGGEGDVIVFARCSWYWHILPFKIHFGPANHLTSNHKRSFERLKLL